MSDGSRKGRMMRSRRCRVGCRLVYISFIRRVLRGSLCMWSRNLYLNKWGDRCRESRSADGASQGPIVSFTSEDIRYRFALFAAGGMLFIYFLPGFI